MRAPSSAVIIGVVALFCGGLGGSVFTWWMTRPQPTVISYQASSTKLGGAQGLFPGVRIKIGSDEIETAHIHTLEFISQSGPYMDSADPVIAFGPNARFFGQVITQAPDPVHHITCQASGSTLKCSMAPFTGKGERYRVTVASDQDTKPEVFLAAKGVEFKPWEAGAKDATLATNIMVVLGWLAMGIFVLRFI